MNKLHSAKPWFFLTALLALVPVLNNKYPAAFFPAVPPGLIELVTVFGGAVAAAMGFARVWAVAKRRSRAREILRAVGKDLGPSDQASENDLAHAGRLVSRLVRNAGSDLGEMGPDLSWASLGRLRRVIPDLLDEIGNEEDARIRLGIVGVYLGETLCRTQGWRWDFRAKPELAQFTYLASRLEKGGRALEVFGWAGLLMTGEGDWGRFLREAGE